MSPADALLASDRAEGVPGHPHQIVTRLSIDVLESSSLPDPLRRQIRDLCTEAYREDFSNYLETLGAGVHVIGRLGDRIVSHAMWVTRALQPEGRRPLRTAYVEAVATRPGHERHGFASQLLRCLAKEIRDYDLGGLSPSDDRFYARLGWELWRGPLFVRTETGLQATPNESVMILRLRRTPVDLDLTAPLSAEWRPGELW
jgi:aminoglycoside 2'-N-acetyltransferase I